MASTCSPLSQQGTRQMGQEKNQTHQRQHITIQGRPAYRVVWGVSVTNAHPASKAPSPKTGMQWKNFAGIVDAAAPGPSWRSAKRKPSAGDFWRDHG